MRSWWGERLYPFTVRYEPKPQEERCCECDSPTGHAGRGEDSHYCDVCDRGPFCDECWAKHEHNPDREDTPHA